MISGQWSGRQWAVNSGQGSGKPGVSVQLRVGGVVGVVSRIPPLRRTGDIGRLAGKRRAELLEPAAFAGIDQLDCAPAPGKLCPVISPVPSEGQGAPSFLAWIGRKDRGHPPT